MSVTASFINFKSNSKANLLMNFPVKEDHDIMKVLYAFFVVYSIPLHPKFSPLWFTFSGWILFQESMIGIFNPNSSNCNKII